MTTISLTQKKDNVTTRATALRFALGIALSALSGGLFLLAFPPYGLWPLAWFGLVPALLAQYRLLPAKWTSLASAIYAAVWLGPFLARLFGPEVWAILSISWLLDRHPELFRVQGPKIPRIDPLSLVHPAGHAGLGRL